MTENEWLTSDDPQAMLERITKPGDSAYPQPKRASDRKLRLFSCASAREIWHLLTDERSRTAVEVAERFLDGSATKKELAAAEAAAYLAAGSAVWSRQAALLRDIFGNPFRPIKPIIYGIRTSSAVIIEDDQLVRAWKDEWLRYHDGIIPTMARVIYDERRFEDMPILGDALEEAGCTNEDILRHCRGWERCPWADDDPAKDHGGKDWKEMACLCRGTGWRVKSDAPHVRGCWVLDLLLGKE